MYLISSQAPALDGASISSVLQTIFTTLVILSLCLAVLCIRRWSKIHFPVPKQNSEPKRITIVLPTWNEEKVIASKLEDVISQNYPMEYVELIVIDSASQDSTIEIVENWHKGRKSANPRFKLIKEKSREGKSVSINQAFSSADTSSEILMMSDVDCRLEDDVFSRISSWFSDPSIGAVTGRQILLNPDHSAKSSQEVNYRDFFSRIRVAESRLHSTPIFHGECAAYRREALIGHKLVENANADDSQMAVSSVRSGFRSIYDPETLFYEMAPPDGRSSRIQKIRRAQGLVRHFWRNREMVFNSEFGSFRKIMALEFTLHILTPIFVFLGFLFGFIHLFSIIGEFGFDHGTMVSDSPMIESLMIYADFLVIFLLFSGFSGIRVPGGEISLTFFNYMMVLLQAIALILFGKSLHKWQQVPSVREALAEHDSRTGLSEK